MNELNALLNTLRIKISKWNNTVILGRTHGQPATWTILGKEFNVFNNIEKLKTTMIDDCDGKAKKGRWFWVGIENFVKLCEKHGFTILERDLNIDKTNPLTLFTKK